MLRLRTAVSARRLQLVSQSVTRILCSRAAAWPAGLAARSASASSRSRASASDGGDDEEKQVESRYQRKTQREHILLRPDPYLGSMQRETSIAWVLGADGKSVVARECSYVHGLYQTFDEILVNAADNVQRNKGRTKMTCIRVDIDAKANSISIYNDGAGIPVQMHSKEKLWVPELIFGHLLTSSNYDDTEKRLTGGRHGYGAKLTNIFSTEFAVDVLDANANKRYQQRFTNNMETIHAPVITSAGKKGESKAAATDGSDGESDEKSPRAGGGSAELLGGMARTTTGSGNYTRITFSPDLVRFGVKGGKGLAGEADLLAVMHRRVVDVAALVGEQGVKVYLNGTLVPVHSFADYIKLFPAPQEGKLLLTSPSKHWQIAVGPTDSVEGLADGGPPWVSFVNCISTPQGGTHVDYVANAIARHVAEHINKTESKSDVSVTPAAVRQHLRLFVKAEIHNPEFQTQNKTRLSSPPSKFGTTCDIKDSFLKAVVKESGLVEAVVDWAKHRQRSQLRQKSAKKSKAGLSIPKLDDANWAGGERGAECTLILTEGDSAKALAVAGLSVLGRDRYGVFPLKGKMLNVRDAKHSTVMDNKEIEHVWSILGLRVGCKYETAAERATLRYGRVMLMTDQDHDGSHIKGLFINMLDHYWPALLKQNGFLEEFVTAIVKASKGRETKTFFTIPEYLKWRDELGAEATRAWRIKYYKGLGTNTAAEGKEYFSALERHRIKFQWGGDPDAAAIDLAFNKHKADQRKEWLLNNKPGSVYVDHSVKQLTYHEFVNKELIQFSHADNVRSIPSLMDGLKPGQRKVLFACLKRNLTKEIKVAQLAGYVSEQTGYHHGEASLHGTIVHMAQDYPGSNNLPLLVPSGQFGTRSMGGKDAASPRYIFTRLDPITRLLFREEDDNVLQPKDEEGLLVEPDWYVPVIPLALVNGADGIGTGFSTSIPAYNPLDVINNIRLKLKGQKMQPMRPWYRGHRGQITKDSAGGGWVSHGVARVKPASGRGKKSGSGAVVEVLELPVGTWTQDYKDWLAKMMNAPTTTLDVRAVRDENTNEAVRFAVTLGRLPKLRRKSGSGGSGGSGGEELTGSEASHGDMSEGSAALALSPAIVESAFRLTANISENNMHLFDAMGAIRKYSGPLEIIEDFFRTRLEFYAKRRAFLLAQLGEAHSRLSNRMRFIEMVTSGKLVVYQRKKADLVAELLRLGFAPASQFVIGARAGLARLGAGARKAGASNGNGGPGVDADADDDAPAEAAGAADAAGAGAGAAGEAKSGKGAKAAAVVDADAGRAGANFDYLLNQPLSALTKERLALLEAEIQQKQTALAQLQNATPQDLWLADLEALQKALVQLSGYSGGKAS